VFEDLFTAGSFLEQLYHKWAKMVNVGENCENFRLQIADCRLNSEICNLKSEICNLELIALVTSWPFCQDFAMTAPAMTILIVSHNKPRLLPEAMASVLAQSEANWQAILFDSGLLWDQGYFNRQPWTADPRLRLVRSTETPALRRRKAMAPWCFNECFRRGLVLGELVMYLCDDDILYPEAFATFMEAFAKNQDAMAMYASQDVGWLGPDGQSKIVGARRALVTGGRCCAGRIMDCQVDYLQLCHRRDALQSFPTDEYWPEDKATGDHADGLFMEKLGSCYPILPIDRKVSLNRRTPWSVNMAAAKNCDDFAGQRRPVHETIMEAWVKVKDRLNGSAAGADLERELAEFQGQLRQLCEQDLAQRRRLASRRYRWVDRLHELLVRKAK
jgi:hypothetical protein